MRTKHFNSFLYTKGKFGKRMREILDTDTEYLYSKGFYKTKIKAEDLPNDYVKIHSRSIWYMTGYLKTSGVVDIQYRYSVFNHMFKDDYLYISYNEPIEIKTNSLGLKSYNKVDFALCGNDIINVLLAIEKNSNIDISRIKALIEEKRAYYEKHHNDDYMRELGNALASGEYKDIFDLYSRD